LGFHTRLILQKSSSHLQKQVSEKESATHIKGIET